MGRFQTFIHEVLMETHKIQLGQYQIDYQLYIKRKNKRLYLRIKEGKLVISTPPYVNIYDIEDFIRQHQEYIIKHIHEYKPKASLVDGGYVYIFGNPYQIVLCDTQKKKCLIDESSLYVYHQNIKETVENHMRTMLLAYITEYIKNRQKVITRVPEITIRKMTSRWGSCFTTKNKVSFNLALIHLDTDLIDYVILHELCHFIEANHSPLFYQEIQKHMPDYKQRIQRLKEVGI
jgi:Predicted metal-dependent hydrolase